MKIRYIRKIRKLFEKEQYAKAFDYCARKHISPAEMNFIVSSPWEESAVLVRILQVRLMQETGMTRVKKWIMVR